MQHIPDGAIQIQIGHDAAAKRYTAEVENAEFTSMPWRYRELAADGADRDEAFAAVKRLCREKGHRGSFVHYFDCYRHF